MSAAARRPEPHPALRTAAPRHGTPGDITITTRASQTTPYPAGHHAVRQQHQRPLAPKREDELNDIRPNRSIQFFETQPVQWEAPAVEIT
jgi:hypothetical protein